MASCVSLARALAVAGFAAMCGVSPALAERVDLAIFENDDNADVADLDLWVDVVGSGQFVDFVFHNDSSIQSVVTAIYFEFTDFTSLGLAAPTLLEMTSGVEFSDGSRPRNPAGSIRHFGGSWGGSLYSADANPPGPFTGINAGVGETLTIRFELVGGTTAGQVADALRMFPSDFRVAQHIQALPDGSSVWSINEGAIPTPGSLLLFGAAAIFATRRRR